MDGFSKFKKDYYCNGTAIMLSPYTYVCGASLQRLLVVYDRLTPVGAAVALAGYFARDSTEGAPGLAIKPQWPLQPGSVLTRTDHNNYLVALPL